MLRAYFGAAMRYARYVRIAQDGLYYGEIPGFEGVYAEAESLEECRAVLEAVLEEWVFLRVSRNQSLPVADGIDLRVRNVH